jgi:hypothetical protein
MLGAGGGDETYSDFLWRSVTSIHSNPLYIRAPGATRSAVPLPENDRIVPRGVI